MKRQTDIDKLDNDDLKLARNIERKGLATISAAARTIVRANEGDKTAMATLSSWEKSLKS
jgi:hypothetical protein